MVCLAECNARAAARLEAEVAGREAVPEVSGPWNFSLLSHFGGILSNFRELRDPRVQVFSEFVLGSDFKGGVRIARGHCGSSFFYKDGKLKDRGQPVQLESWRVSVDKGTALCLQG